MKPQWLLILFATGAMLAWLPKASAQSAPSRLAQATPNQRQAPRSPKLDAEDQLTPGQIERAQEPERPPAPSAKPPVPKRSAQLPRVVDCSGVFAGNSDHNKLSFAFKPENVDFTEVDAGEGKKVMASVVFPKDPKRRLEVWWRDEANASGTYLIVIGGQSTWAGPKGVRLGMDLAALEKLNGNPFKLMGFGADGVAPVTDWQNGAFNHVGGDCGLRVSFRADPKTLAARSAVSSDKEFSSKEAVLRGAKPRISEILIGY